MKHFLLLLIVVLFSFAAKSNAHNTPFKAKAYQNTSYFELSNYLVSSIATEPVNKCRTCALLPGDHVAPVRYAVSDYSAPEYIVWVEYYPGSPWLANATYLGKNCTVSSIGTYEGVDCAYIVYHPSTGVNWGITWPCAKLVKL